MSDLTELLRSNCRALVANMPPEIAQGFLDGMVEWQAADRIDQLEAKNNAKTELLNDVLGVAVNKARTDVWATNLSRDTSIGLPEHLRWLWGDAGGVLAGGCGE